MKVQLASLPCVRLAILSTIGYQNHTQNSKAVGIWLNNQDTFIDGVDSDKNHKTLFFMEFKADGTSKSVYYQFQKDSYTCLIIPGKWSIQDNVLSLDQTEDSRLITEKGTESIPGEISAMQHKIQKLTETEFVFDVMSQPDKRMIWKKGTIPPEFDADHWKDR